MKNFVKVALAASAFAFIAPAQAILVSTTDGVISTTAGTASFGEVGIYEQGGGGLTGRGLVWPLDAGDGLNNVSQEASNIDNYWLNYNSSAVGGPGAGSIIWNLSNPTENILAVSGIDHGPSPYEALEFIIWGQRADGSWEEGSITAIYDDGVDAAFLQDDLSSVWNFSAAYTRFAASGGTHYNGPNGGALRGGEGEIDGIAAFAAVPEPSIITLFGLGLLGLGFARRRKV